MSKGVVVIAIGKPAYGKMAWNLCMSIKATSEGIPVHLIHDDSAIASLDDWRIAKFDSMDKIENDDCFQDYRFQPGKAKLSIYKYLPFEENMIIDADSVCIRDLNELFMFCEGSEIISQAVGCWDQTADKWTCQWMPLDRVKEVFKMPETYRIFEINSSFMYIKKGKKAEEFYKHALENFHQGYNSQHLYKWGGTFPDELAYNVAFAQCGIEPVFYDQSIETLSSDSQKPIYFSTRYVNNWSYILSNYHFMGYFGGGDFTSKSLQDQCDRQMVAHLSKFGIEHHYKIKHLMKSKHILSK